MEEMYKNFDELMKSRSKMNLSLSKNDVKRIWGKRFLKTLDEKRKSLLVENRNIFVEDKIKIAKENIKKLKISKWVKFIGISGSVAAGFAKDEDDIDIFVVVKNGTMWLYRGLVVFFSIFHNQIRAKRQKSFKNKLCLNLICEERGLQFDNDTFNFHELMFIIPIHNENYLNYIYSQNQWLRNSFNVKKENLKTRERRRKNTFFLIKIFNYIAFLAQLIFMFLAGHNPDISRLKKDNKKGKIEFFEKDYKNQV